MIWWEWILASLAVLALVGRVGGAWWRSRRGGSYDRLLARRVAPTSWAGYAPGRDRSLKVGFRLGLLEVEAPHLGHDVALGPVPSPYSPILLPAVFSGRHVQTSPWSFAMGDYAAVAGRLDRAVEAVQREKVWRVVSGGRVCVLGYSEPDVADLKAWLGLALGAVRSLA